MGPKISEQILRKKIHTLKVRGATSPSSVGALAHCLQHCTTCKIQYGRNGALKWQQAVPPLWSRFQGFGPHPDFFVQSGPDFAEKSGFSIESWKERLKCHISVCVDSLNLYGNVAFKR